MSRRVLIVFWWLVIAESRAVSGEQCHPPSLETCTRDLLTSAADFPNVNWTEIQQIRENNCSLNSSGCQEVFCLNSTTLSTTKGRIAWQPTTVGYRRLNLCPFAHTEKVYAFRDCLVSTNQTISPTINWTQEDTSECPLPPFSMEIEKIYNKIHLRRMYTKCYCSIILTSLSYALKVRLYYSDDPVLSEDHLRTMKICIDWVTNCSSYSILSTDVLWNASDLLLSKDFIGFWDQDTGVRFLSYLSWIFRTNESSGQEHDFFNGSNIYVYEQMVGESISFQFPVDPYDLITATVNAIAPEGTVISNTGSFLIKFSRIPYNISNSFGLYMPDKSDNLDGEYKMFGPLFYIQFQAKSRLSNEAGNTANKSISVNVTFQGPDLNSGPGWDLECGRISSDSPYKSTDTPMQHWTQDCQTEATNATVLCRCVSPAFVTVFRKRNGAGGSPGASGPYQSTPTLPTRPSTKPPSKPDISVFFGFPYDRDIYITGEVFKAISLTCLVITVSAYTICRKARKGATTNILLNLCVSLIVLIIVLYIAAYEANSEIGCRVLNVLRYYLALVSLLWNAVEAHNMYRMLVKVFHAETSHFVLIAGIFAWGLPMLAVGIILAINIRAFDGSYEDDDAECTFRCALRFETRLYGWIVPMSIIILHNLIVFAMVLKVICRTNTLQASGQTKGRSAGKRLCGALTMLVLLGFPWIISVFGLIDTPSNSAGVLQKACSGLLVIFVGLQGLFIFHFHCVRNRTIRDLTKTHINTSLLTLKRSTSKSGVSSPNKSNAITASTRDVQNSTSMQDVTNSTSMQDAENSTLMQDVENGTSMQDVQNSTSMQVVENTTSTQDVQNSTSTQDVQNSTSM